MRCLSICMPTRAHVFMLTVAGLVGVLETKPGAVAGLADMMMNLLRATGDGLGMVVRTLSKGQ